MIRRATLLVAAVAAAVALLHPQAAVAGYASCPGAFQPGASVNGSDDAAHTIVKSSALSVEAPGRDVWFTYFAYVYETQGAGLYLSDTGGGLTVTPLASTAATDVKKVLAKLRAALVPISAGAAVLLDDGWTLQPPLQCHP